MFKLKDPPWEGRDIFLEQPSPSHLTAFGRNWVSPRIYCGYEKEKKWLGESTEKFSLHSNMRKISE